ncbi:MAG: hybrid sensor histidine kinase/response regulator [Synechococcaceae cyanobacterium RL_1_2]|nr:hybrid sensor histidine kinase/response regulator [Synechococcaceae cyanobacterium RL_1_2]
MDDMVSDISLGKESSIDDDFKDLEKLLEDTERLAGGASSAKSSGNASTSRPSVNKRPTRAAAKSNIFDQTMKVSVKQLDNLSNLMGELVVNRNTLEQDQERLRQFVDSLLERVQKLSDIGGTMQDLYERSLLESSLLASRGKQYYDRNTTVPGMNHHHQDDEYDPLEMDRFSEFHELTQEMIELIVRVRESSSDIQFIVDETDQVARNLRQVTTQLQEGLNKSRMVPFSQTTDRFTRYVREQARTYDKKADLHVEGKEVLIDKLISEHLSDPMKHLINNALTHGIETPQERKSAGKVPTGKISIKAFIQGNQTVISFADDGAGINVERVKMKAVEKGLVTRSEARNMPKHEVYDLLFHSGFSTKDQVEALAGRGVGMDVVRTNLSEIRGSVTIDSKLGQGTTFNIRLPLTLSICKALCCVNDHAKIAFPMDGVEDMQDYLPDEIITNEENQHCVMWRDTLLPIRPLSQLISYNRQLSRATVYGGSKEDETISVVVLRSAGQLLAIQVDQVVGEQEIVIKQITGPIPKPAGIAGATVMGDGCVMPIGDVLELIEIAEGIRSKEIGMGGVGWSPAAQVIAKPSSTELAEPLVLIIDDSITVRELLSISFTKAGYRVEQARDGQEAWEKLKSGLPCDIVFCDVEMPRMDGLEFLSHVNNDPKLRKIPVAMLTSRGAERHRQVAAENGASGYFTKPYLEEVLLDAAERMIGGAVLLENSIREPLLNRQTETSSVVSLDHDGDGNTMAGQGAVPGLGEEASQANGSSSPRRKISPDPK